jgi:hypothetical protein
VPFALLHVPDLGSQEIAHMSVKVYLFLLGSTFVATFFLGARFWCLSFFPEADGHLSLVFEIFFLFTSRGRKYQEQQHRERREK